MAIELTEYEWTARLVKSGDDVFDVVAGKSVEVAYWAPGRTIVLDETCPEGKAWSVRVIVEITETDV